MILVINPISRARKRGTRLWLTANPSEKMAFDGAALSLLFRSRAGESIDIPNPGAPMKARTVLAPLAVALAVSSCSSIGPLPTSPPPANYRALTAAYVNSQKNAAAFKGARISDLRASKAPQPGDWTACLKLVDGSVYVVFFENGQAVDLRLQLAVDACSSPDKPLPAG